ncbi:hypothetical protein [Catellatospora sp. NPDC049609]|uniref:hypothetical protein n=1 Tax=Catellatospora sp. NPDC049609 TaxID=3155505 RepID=UPI00342FFB7C
MNIKERDEAPRVFERKEPASQPSVGDAVHEIARAYAVNRAHRWNSSTIAVRAILTGLRKCP